MSIVMAIDPGNIESAYCAINKETLEPLWIGKVENRELASILKKGIAYDEFVIERVQSYGMAVGRSVFQTCEWTGRFVQIASDTGVPVSYVHRKDEKLHICGDSRAKDTNIRMALIDRFAKTANGKGSKKSPDFFYGFKADIWAAYACGITYIEKGPSEKEDAYED